ncbi:hypothetical protein [Sphingobacterium sp. JUb56]|uniref:hypothetical protein n=1 Tax=Sphingobacterium sp. JUb56 TaxID=2587145 RepID=UPI00161F69C4|nr:hypothetical protein [Sphingobacterium sp. JUb56]MBB2949504.1 hypothetical protein [Sphingobacterium sp. JUb56]
MSKNNFGQDKIGNDFRLLELCCQEVASKFGKTKSELWKNSDYVQLSAQLRRETKVLISENTLKRIFGKLKTTERYYPQKATRDALAAFVGFRDWQEFEKVQNAKETFEPLEVADNRIAPETKTNEISPSKKTGVNRLFIFACLVALVLLTAVWTWWPRSEKNPAVYLKCLNPEGHTPHSAIFKLIPKDDAHLRLSDYEIEFKDGKRGRSRFSDSTLTHYYELPGVYFPILYYKNRIIDTARVFLATDGWEATAQIQYDTTRVYPILLPKSINRQIPPNLSIHQILTAGVDTVRTFFTHYANMQPTAISGDNMMLEAFITTSKERPGVRCSQVDITLYGEKDRHELSLMKPECTAWSSYKFSEKYKSGKSEDLRALGHNLSNGGHIKLTIINKVVTLYIEGQKVFQTHYENSIGNILGANLMFSGIGKFSNFKMESLP